jgi:hypothetical protein
VDVVIARAVAALFGYEDNQLESTAYIPDRSPRPEIIHIESPLDRRAFNISASLLRLKKEIEAAVEVVQEQPDLVLLDGSIVPQYTDRPAEGTEAREIYEEVVELYEEMFEEAVERQVLLAGVIEDSRGTAFGQVLAEQEFLSADAKEVLGKTQDTNILQYMLEKGERTAVMRYTEEYEKHPTLQDIGELSDRVHNFYLKTARNDRPVRVDFLSLKEPVEAANEVASRIMPLCTFSSSYGIPSVIVEADQRAKLSQHDLEMFESRLKSRVGPLPGIENLRRDSRPF